MSSTLFEAMFQRDPDAPQHYTRRIGDWSTSAPHLLLLSRFLAASSAPRGAAAWEKALGEPLADAVSRFVSLGLLKKAGSKGKAEIYECTEEAVPLVNKYLERRQEAHDRARADCLAALQREDFEAACRAVASYEAGQVFPRPRRGSWARYNPTSDIKRLQALFAEMPASGEQRIGAAMRLLWGEDSSS